MKGESDMAGGLVALLDDIATLAKVAAASIDDVSAGAAQASAKAAGVIIDDTAVTPQYVRGLSPARELPVIARIARGSLLNKLLIILPAALLLSWLAPWLLPVLLVVGGAFLCFEGAEKVLHMLHVLPEHHSGSDGVDTVSGEDMERQVVASAVRTDLILSAEIMLIALADLAQASGTMRVAILTVVAFTMTFFVYGVVAILVKMDDFGVLLVRRGGSAAAVGAGIVRVMPRVFAVISVVGMLAMLWVGGHIVIVALADLGVGWLHHAVDHVVHMVEAGDGVLMWLVETVLSGVFGVIFGSVLAVLVTLGQRARGARYVEV